MICLDSWKEQIKSVKSLTNSLKLSKIGIQDLIMAKRRNRKRSGGIAREDYRQGGRVGYQVGGPKDQQTCLLYTSPSPRD